mgnify:CR=1 FL=1
MFEGWTVGRLAGNWEGWKVGCKMSRVKGWKVGWSDSWLVRSLSGNI